MLYIFLQMRMGKKNFVLKNKRNYQFSGAIMINSVKAITIPAMLDSMGSLAFMVARLLFKSPNQ